MLPRPLENAVLSLVKREAEIKASSQGFFAIKQYSSHSSYSQQFPRKMIGMHLAAFFGANAVVRLLLEKGAELESKDEGARRRCSGRQRDG